MSRRFSKRRSDTDTTNDLHIRNPFSRRGKLKDIADSTLDVLKAGSYELDGTTHDIAAAIQESESGTKFFSHTDVDLTSWLTPPSRDARQTDVSIVEMSTMACARQYSSIANKKMGILNFASATKPGGGFLGGASAQEESIARSSTLYPTLMIPEAHQFYTLHLDNKKLKSAEKKEGEGEGDMMRNEAYYTHSMIYSPDILLIRDDDGNWTEPCKVDVLTSAAVNAGVVRQENRKSPQPAEEFDLEANIEPVMRERMARVLALFERNNIDDIVLGSFGTGVFQNKVEVVARIWAELLGVGVGEGKTEEGYGRFKGSFDKVLFAIIDNRTYKSFETAFWGAKEEPQDV